MLNKILASSVILIPVKQKETFFGFLGFFFLSVFFHLLFRIELSSEVHLSVSATLFLTVIHGNELRLILILKISSTTTCRSLFYLSIAIYDSMWWFTFDLSLSFKKKKSVFCCVSQNCIQGTLEVPNIGETLQPVNIFPSRFLNLWPWRCILEHDHFLMVDIVFKKLLMLACFSFHSWAKHLARCFFSCMERRK